MDKSGVLFRCLQSLGIHSNATTSKTASTGYPSLLTRAMSSALPQAAEQKAIHDEDNREFYIELEEDGKKKHKALLQYELLTDGTMDLYHTEVPPVFRGKGVAKILAKTALDFVVEKDAKMILSCTYLIKYVKENPLPQYTSRVDGKL